MKTLFAIAVLFACLQVNGQKGIWEIGQPYPKPNEPINLYDLLHLYDLYEEECYADSTVEYYTEYRDGSTTWRMPCNNYEFLRDKYPCPEHWVHKQPTFEGFIEYLRKRYDVSQP